MEESRIRAALDSCMLTDAGWMACHDAMRGDHVEERLAEMFEDGFEDWQEQEAHEHKH